MKIEIYKGENNQFYWKLIAKNGQTIAIGGEGYKTLAKLKKSLEKISKDFPSAIEWKLVN